jgi:adhesin HecA-like repeat protein
MHLDGILNFWGSAVSGVLRLEQAKVAGQVCLHNATIGSLANSVEAVAAYGLAVDGGLDCVGLNAHGSVSVQVAIVTGSLALTDARISYPGQRALVADNASIGGRLDCRGMAVEGETRMHNCHVAGSMVMAGARLDNPGGVALSAGGLTVDGGVFFTGRFTSQGEVRMVGARLGANLTLAEATISNPGGLAINLDRAKIGILHGADLSCEGQTSLAGTEIAGDLNLMGAELDAGGAPQALVAEGASIGGALILTSLQARGEVNLRTIRVGQRALLMKTALDNPGKTACRLSRAQVGADMFCDDMTAEGSIRLAGATIGGELSLRKSRMRNATGIALDAPTLNAREFSLRPAEPIQGLVDLSHAQIGILRDDPSCWADKLHLDGLTYQALDPQLPASERLRWLARDPRGHQPQPYEQLAAHYSAAGQPAQARSVLYAKERNQRRAKTPLARIWSLLQDVTVGYGYQPWRALAWLVVLLATGSIIFAIAPPAPLQPATAPHFNPVIYTLDLLLPVVDLGQKYAFNPAGAEQWFSYILVAAGWVLVTTVAAGAARILSRR